MDLEEHHRWWKSTGRNAVNVVLREEWNPIGVSVPPDEYSGYAGTVGRLLSEHESAAAVAAFLGTARAHIGLGPDAAVDERVAERLVALYPD